MASTADRIAVVTGATSGIGRAAAAALAGSGFHVLAVGRDDTRGRQVAEELGANGEFVAADFLSLSAIERLAASIRESHDGVDLVVNNAGVTLREKQLTADGIERTFMVNTVAPYLLTHELLNPLASSAGRVVNVATELRSRFRLAVGDLRDPPRYSAFRAYSSSKLALMMLTIEQASRYAERGISVVAIHPGVVFDTNLSAEMPRALMRLGPLAARLLGRRSSSVTDAGRAILRIATDPVRTGTMYSNGRPLEPPAQAHEATTRAALWTLLGDLTSRA